MKPIINSSGGTVADLSHLYSPRLGPSSQPLGIGSMVMSGTSNGGTISPQTCGGWDIFQVFGAGSI